MKNYFFAMRPKTLFVSLSVWIVSVGVVILYFESFSYFLNSIILLCVLSLQILVNYLNDLIDAQRGKDTEKRLGPLRYVKANLITPNNMKKASLFFLLLTIVCGSYLVMIGGFFILLIGVLSILLTYFYSAPPLSIADRGLADIFVFLFFGVIAVLGIVYINYAYHQQSELLGPIVLSSLIAGAQVGLLSVSLAVINHIRDREEDLKSGKNTLAVRFGSLFAKKEWLFCITTSYLLGFYWVVVQNNTAAFFGPMIALPIYFWVWNGLLKEVPSEKYNKYLAATSLGQLLFSTFLFLSLSFHV